MPPCVENRSACGPSPGQIANKVLYKAQLNRPISNPKTKTREPKKIEADEEQRDTEFDEFIASEVTDRTAKVSSASDVLLATAKKNKAVRKGQRAFVDASLISVALRKGQRMLHTNFIGKLATSELTSTEKAELSQWSLETAQKGHLSKATIANRLATAGLQFVPGGRIEAMRDRNQAIAVNWQADKIRRARELATVLVRAAADREVPILEPISLKGTTPSAALSGLNFKKVLQAILKVKVNSRGKQMKKAMDYDSAVHLSKFAWILLHSQEWKYAVTTRQSSSMAQRLGAMYDTVRRDKASQYLDRLEDGLPVERAAGKTSKVKESHFRKISKEIDADAQPRQVALASTPVAVGESSGKSGRRKNPKDMRVAEKNAAWKARDRAKTHAPDVPETGMLKKPRKRKAVPARKYRAIQRKSRRDAKSRAQQARENVSPNPGPRKSKLDAKSRDQLARENQEKNPGPPKFGQKRRDDNRANKHTNAVLKSQTRNLQEELGRRDAINEMNNDHIIALREQVANLTKAAALPNQPAVQAVLNNVCLKEVEPVLDENGTNGGCDFLSFVANAGKKHPYMNILIDSCSPRKPTKRPILNPDPKKGSIDDLPENFPNYNTTPAEGVIYSWVTPVTDWSQPGRLEHGSIPRELRAWMTGGEIGRGELCRSLKRVVATYHAISMVAILAYLIFITVQYTFGPSLSSFASSVYRKAEEELQFHFNQTEVSRIERLTFMLYHESGRAFGPGFEEAFRVFDKNIIPFMNWVLSCFRSSPVPYFFGLVIGTVTLAELGYYLYAFFGFTTVVTCLIGRHVYNVIWEYRLYLRETYFTDSDLIKAEFNFRERPVWDEEYESVKFFLTILAIVHILTFIPCMKLTLQIMHSRWREWMSRIMGHRWDKHSSDRHAFGRSLYEEYDAGVTFHRVRIIRDEVTPLPAGDVRRVGDRSVKLKHQFAPAVMIHEAVNYGGFSPGTSEYVVESTAICWNVCIESVTGVALKNTDYNADLNTVMLARSFIKYINVPADFMSNALWTGKFFEAYLMHMYCRRMRLTLSLNARGNVRAHSTFSAPL